MDALTSLYQLCEEQNITVDCFGLERMSCLSILDENGDAHIAIDPLKLQNETDELIKLAHEVGHCATGACYGRHAAYSERCQQEERAWRWAVKHLVPKEKLLSAYEAGYQSYWELAEHLGLPEAVIRRAVETYQRENGGI